MIWKKLFKPKQPDQSQSISGTSMTGGMTQMGQAGGDMQQSQTGNPQTQQQGLTGAEVVDLLEKLEAAVKGAGLDPTMQEELMDYLRPAKREAAKATPNKELVGQNLKQASETLKTLKEATDAGKGLWQTGAEVFKAVAPWIGVTVAFFGL